MWRIPPWAESASWALVLVATVSSLLGAWGLWNDLEPLRLQPGLLLFAGLALFFCVVLLLLAQYRVRLLTPEKAARMIRVAIQQTEPRIVRKISHSKERSDLARSIRELADEAFGEALVLMILPDGERAVEFANKYNSRLAELSRSCRALGVDDRELQQLRNGDWSAATCLLSLPDRING